MLRVGGVKPRKVDVRIVAASNRPIHDEIAAGRFREDLFFRLDVIPIQLAPLRERREDIIPLTLHFLARQTAETGRHLVLTAEAEEALWAHRWPGKELENALERGSVLARGDTITPAELLLEQSGATPRATMTGTLQESIDKVVAERIEAAVEAARGNRAEAARNLGIDRATLWRLMKRHWLQALRFSANACLAVQMDARARAGSFLPKSPRVRRQSWWTS